MLDRLTALRRGDHGFSLVELQVVVLVIGLLTGAGAYAVGAAQSRAVTAACRADVATVTMASAAYRAQDGGYASAVDDAAHSATTLVGAGYLKAAPAGSGYTVSYRPVDGSVTGSADGGSC